MVGAKSNVSYLQEITVCTGYWEFKGTLLVPFLLASNLSVHFIYLGIMNSGTRTVWIEYLQSVLQNEDLILVGLPMFLSINYN